MEQMQVDDAAAVARARGGDEEAFRGLVERHSRSIYRLAYRMTGRPEDAEEAVQDAFVRAYRQLGRFEARSNFATWLYRIAFNCAIGYLRAVPQGRPKLEPAPAVVRPQRGRRPTTWSMRRDWGTCAAGPGIAQRRARSL
jgi:RNA polymerase sigma-70 factor (ECF subfamily)